MRDYAAQSTYSDYGEFVLYERIGIRSPSGGVIAPGAPATPLVLAGRQVNDSPTSVDTVGCSPEFTLAGLLNLPVAVLLLVMNEWGWRHAPGVLAASWFSWVLLLAFSLGYGSHSFWMTRLLSRWNPLRRVRGARLMSHGS